MRKVGVVWVCIFKHTSQVVGSSDVTSGSSERERSGVLALRVTGPEVP